MTAVLAAFPALHAWRYAIVGGMRLAFVLGRHEPCLTCGLMTPEHVVNGEQVVALHIACGERL